MKAWVITNSLYIAGALAGALAGFLYWKFIGCVSGTCPITSNPYRSSLYFSVMGLALFGMFKRNNKS